MSALKNLAYEVAADEMLTRAEVDEINAHGQNAEAVFNRAVANKDAKEALTAGVAMQLCDKAAKYEAPKQKSNREKLLAELGSWIEALGFSPTEAMRKAMRPTPAGYSLHTHYGQWASDALASGARRALAAFADGRSFEDHVKQLSKTDPTMEQALEDTNHTGTFYLKNAVWNAHQDYCRQLVNDLAAGKPIELSTADPYAVMVARIRSGEFV